MSGYSASKGIKLRGLLEAGAATFAVISETRQSLSTLLSGIGKPWLIEGKAGITTGVALVFCPNSGFEVLEKSERIIVGISPAGIQVVGVYGAPETANVKEKLSFWAQLDTTLTKVLPKTSTTIIIGDFNAGHEKRIGGKPPSGGPNIDRLLDLVKKHNLSIVETAPTWKSRRTDKATRTLDRCLIHTEDECDYKADVSWEDCLADHATLTCQIYFKCLSRNIGRPKNKPNQQRSLIDFKWDLCKSNIIQSIRDTPQNDAESLSLLNRFWKLRKEYERDTRKPLTLIQKDGRELDTAEALEEANTYLKAVWSSSESHSEILLFPTITKSQPPSRDEVEVSIKSLTKAATKGRDTIKAEHAINSPKILRIYHEILSEIWTSGEIPQDWKDMRVKLLPKQDLSKTTIDKTRPITCLSTSLKILNGVITQRTTQEYEKCLHPNQHGYRSARSIWTAKEMLVRKIRAHGKCIVVFLDMSKAFDSVTRVTLTKVLEQWETPTTEKNLILEQYRGSQVFIEINGKTSTPFEHKVGVRQGCVLSGWLFNMVMSRIHHAVEAKITPLHYDLISYSDDIIIVTKHRREADIMVKITEEEIQKAGLRLNLSKTTFQEFDLEVQSTSTTEWLGTKFSSNLEWTPEIATRITKVNTAGEELRKLITLKNIKIPTEMMLQILKSLVFTHIKYPLDVVEFSNQNVKDIINLMLKFVLLHTNMTEADALIQTEKLWFDHDDSKKKRTKFGSKDAPPPTVEKLITPTPEVTIKRKAELVRLRENRKICELCHKYFAQIDSHRHLIHGLPKLERLEVWCETCKRHVVGGHYVHHVCLSRVLVDKDMVACPFCNGKFTQHGLNRHKVSCKSRTRVQEVETLE